MYIYFSFLKAEVFMLFFISCPVAVIRDSQKKKKINTFQFFWLPCLNVISLVDNLIN